MRPLTGAWLLGVGVLLSACSAQAPETTPATVTVTQPAAPSTLARDENAFRAALAGYDVDVDTALAVGHKICDAMDAGASAQDAADSVKDAIVGLNKTLNPTIPRAIGTATAKLCPLSIP